MKQQNKNVPESFSQKFREWWCRQFGCLTHGPYYHMAQGYCRRCGHINKHYNKDTSPEWDNEIWGPFFN